MRCCHYKRRALSDWVALAAVAFSILLLSTASFASDRIGAGAHRLSGVIKGAFGRPIVGAEVRLEDGGRVVARTHTDAAGAFLFKSVPLGTHVLRVNKQGFKPTVETIVVGSEARSEPLTVTMELKRPLTFTLTMERLNRARNDLAPEIGATAYHFDQDAIHELPEGQNTNLAQVLQQAPGVSQDSYGQGQEQIHVHGENGGGIQYRINDIFMPEAVTSFGEIFSPRFVHSITLLTGVLPAEIGYRNEGVIDIHTKDGCTDGGPDNDNVEIYGGQRRDRPAEFRDWRMQGAVQLLPERLLRAHQPRPPGAE